MEKRNGSIIIDGNSKCLNTCVFCPGLGRNVSSEEKWNTFITEFNHHKNNGIKDIELSGEPGEYDRIVDVVRHLKQNNIDNVLMSTHGRTLKDSSFVKQLKEAGLDSVKIPIYGSIDSIHNRVCQVENSPGNAFEDSIQGIINCIENDIHVKISTMITQYNKDDINNIISLMMKITNNKIYFFTVGIICISKLNTEYTRDWFFPIKDMGEYVRKIIKNYRDKEYTFNFKITDIPYCVPRGYCNLMINLNTYPNLGMHKVSEELKSTVSDSVPHYRIKSYFEECDKCCLKDKCGGVYKNELEMFGVEGLKAIIAV